MWVSNTSASWGRKGTQDVFFKQYSRELISPSGTPFSLRTKNVIKFGEDIGPARITVDIPFKIVRNTKDNSLLTKSETNVRLYSCL